MKKRNPIAMGAAEKIALGLAITGGLTAAVYYATRPSASGPTGPTGPGPAPVPVPGPTGPTGPASGPTGPTGPTAAPPAPVTVTEANNGQTINMVVGQSLFLILTINSTIVEYVVTDSGGNLVEKSHNLHDPTQQSQIWLAQSAGTDTLVCTPTGTGSALTFTIVIAAS